MQTLIDKAEIGGNNRFYSKAWGRADGTHRIFRNATGFQDRNACFSRRQREIEGARKAIQKTPLSTVAKSPLKSMLAHSPISPRRYG